MIDLSKYVFIINPAAGVGSYELLEDMIRRTAVSYRIEPEVIYTTKKGDATDITAQKLEEGIRTIIVAGGDGTFNEVAKAAIEHPVAIGLIPTGSGNGLAHHFRIPLKPYDALRIAFMRTTRLMDVTMINDHLSFNVAGLGLDGEIAQQFGAKGKRGFSEYINLFFKELPFYKTSEMTVRSSDSEITGNYLLAAVCNCSQYGNNARICPNADPFDGLTNIVLVPRLPFYKIPFAIYKLFNGDLTTNPAVLNLNGSGFTISTDRMLPLHVDGEPAGEYDVFNVVAKPESLNLIIPYHVQ